MAFSASNPARLARAAFLFPLALVLFEFSVYIGNDMILPGMLAVTHEFGADISLVPTAMTAYLAGGVLLQWLLGPLSDRIGRRPVLLAGVLCFALACLAALVVGSIEQFFVARLVQGTGLCFVTAVGYAAIQDSFDEVNAVKVTAWMANVALIAPLAGPLAGAALITVAPWRASFVLIAVLALLSLAALYKVMPEPPRPRQSPFSLRAAAADYRAVFGNRRFMLGTIAVGTGCLPMLAWIGASPIILMRVAGLSPLAFGLWQIPVFGALIAGNLAVTRLVDRMPVERLVVLGSLPLTGGVVLAWVAMWFAPARYEWLVLGIGISALGVGIANAALTRLTLFATPVAKGTASAVFGMVSMLIFTAGIELVAGGYGAGGNFFFASVALASGLIFWICIRGFIGKTPGRY